jgi:hypothetical protein
MYGALQTLQDHECKQEVRAINAQYSRCKHALLIFPNTRRVMDTVTWRKATSVGLAEDITVLSSSPKIGYARRGYC